MATIGTAYVQILPSAEGITGKMSEALSGPSRQAGASSGALIGSMMKKYITVAGIGAALTKSVTEGAKLEQSLGGVETLYKNHANIVIENANKAWKTAGVSANDYMEQSTKFAAALLQSLGGDTKAAAKYADMAIIDMSDNANKFGTNIEDIQNAYQGFSKQNYTMLDNLKLGYGGTKTEMQRLLSDAEKISGQKYDIENLNDVYDAIHVIQNDLGVTGTTAKEAASTLSGSFDSMKAAATNFLGALSLGKNVGQTFGELITAAHTFAVGNLVPALLNIAKGLPGVLITGIKQGVPMLIGALPGVINQIFSAAKSMITQIRQFGIEIMDNMIAGLNGQGSGKMGAAIKKILGNVIKIAISIIKGAAGLIFTAAKFEVEMMKRLPALASALAKWISTLPAKLSAFINAAVNKLIKNMGNIATNNVKGEGKKAGDSFVIAMAKALGQLAISLLKLIVRLPAILLPAIGRIGLALGKQLLNSIKTGIGNIGGTIKSKFSSITSAAASAVKSVAARFAGLKSIATAPVRAIQSIITKIKNLKNTLKGAVGKLSLKIPKITLSAGKAPWGIGGKGKKPNFSVKWAAKGGIVDGATLVGAGEKGAEAIVPLDPFWNKLSNGFANFERKLETMSTISQSGGNLTVIMQLDGKTIGQTTVDYINGQTIQYGASPLNI